MAWNNNLGRRGEDIASNFLQEQGLFVLDRNWRCFNLEIDIVARRLDENLLHIIEVKTRTAKNESNYLTAAESVSVAKQRRLVEAARGYLNFNKLDMGVQFDIIAIHFNSDNYEVEWLQDAFFPKLKTYR